MVDSVALSYIAELKRDIGSLREAIAAIEARIAKIEKQLYVPPELIAELMKKGGNR
jgi:hypothetical protein